MKLLFLRRLLPALLCGAPLWAGSVFLTGHDPDFHALLGGNAAGAQAINTAAINYVTDPLFNPYATGASQKFLFVESSIAPPGGHVDGEGGHCCERLHGGHGLRKA